MKRYETRFSRLQLDEQVEDRGLHGDVERRGRLVADDELRVAGERARDRDALLQAAGELARARAERSARRGARDRISSCMRVSAAVPVMPASFFSERQQDPPHRVAPVERRVRDSGRRSAARAGRSRDALLAACGASSRPSSSDRARRRLRRCRAASARASSCRCPTRRRARASRRARSPRETPTSACTSWPLLLEHLAEVVEREQRVGVAVDRAAARGRPPSRAGASGARSWKWQRLMCAAADRRSSGGSSVWQRSSASAQRSAKTQPGSSAPTFGRKPGIVSSRP